MWETALQALRGERGWWGGGGWGKVLQVPGQRFTCGLWKTMMEQGDKPWRSCRYGGYMLGQIYPEGLQPVGETCTGVGEEREVEEVTERSYIDWPQSPILHLLVLLGVGDEIEELRMKKWSWEPGTKEWDKKKVVFQYILVSRYLNLFYFAIN